MHAFRIRACYDAPLRETNGTGGTLALGPFPATSVDRIQLREDQRDSWFGLEFCFPILCNFPTLHRATHIAQSLLCMHGLLRFAIFCMLIGKAMPC